MVKVFCNNCIIALIAVLLLLETVEAQEVKGNMGKAKSVNLKGINTTTIVHNEVRNQTTIDTKEMNTLEKNVLL